MLRIIGIAVALVTSVSVACGCSGSGPTTHQPTGQAGNHRERFVPTPAAFHEQCQSTAREVGYPVPCPMRVPRGFAANQDGAAPSCAITIVCPGIGTSSWHGWAFGETSSPNQHLIIMAAPRRFQNAAKLVVGPYWRAGMQTRPLQWLRIKGRRLHAVFLSQRTCMCAFANHVVLVWTAGRHTYGVGFHDVRGLRQTLLLDVELARHIQLVGPAR